MALYYQFLGQFNIYDDLTAIIVLVFAGATLFSLILRIISCIGYQAQYAVFKLYGKEVKEKSDVFGIKQGLVGKSVADYVKSSEKGSASVSSAVIVSKNITKLGFIFWKFDSMSQFIKSYENSLILIGLLFAVFLDHPEFFGVMAIALFIGTRILAAIFDYDTAKIRLSDEITDYLDREIGQFYAPDLNSGINRLRIEMLEAAANQKAVFENSIQKLSEELTNAMKVALGEMAIDKTVVEWKQAVEGATDYQDKVNTSIDALGTAIGALKSSTNAFGMSINEYSEGMDALVKKMSSQFAAQEFIEKNQTLLADTFQKFELSLQDITGKIGNSLASIIDYRLHESYNTLNERLSENIKQIVNSNNDLMARMQKLFDDFHEQSVAETQAILRVKDQIEIYFEQAKP